MCYVARGGDFANCERLRSEIAVDLFAYALCQCQGHDVGLLQEWGALGQIYATTDIYEAIDGISGSPYV